MSPTSSQAGQRTRLYPKAALLGKPKIDHALCMSHWVNCRQQDGIVCVNSGGKLYSYRCWERGVPIYWQIYWLGSPHWRVLRSEEIFLIHQLDCAELHNHLVSQFTYPIVCVSTSALRTWWRMVFFHSKVYLNTGLVWILLLHFSLLNFPKVQRSKKWQKCT